MGSSTLPVIAAVSGDPGGGRAIAPVLHRLVSDGTVCVRALAYNETREVWRGEALEFDELPETTTVRDAAAWLSEYGVDLLITGTSLNSLELEKVFIAAAHQVGTPSLAILDFWSNYARRFSDEDGFLKYLPDKIAIMDLHAGEAIAAAGIPADRLVVTGQPAFDKLTSARAQFSAIQRDTFRQSIGSRSDDLLVAFFSQPFSELFGKDDSNPEYPGYDEHSIVHALLEALETIAARTGQTISLVIQPHLREDPAWFYDLHSNLVGVVVAQEVDAYQLILSADLVAGMTSTRLVEASCLGRITLSLQVGARGKRHFPATQLGISQSVFSKNTLGIVLGELLIDENIRWLELARSSNLQIDPGAAERVVELIYQTVEIKLPEME